MSTIIVPPELRNVIDAPYRKDVFLDNEEMTGSLGDWGLVSPDRSSDDTPFDHLFSLDSDTETVTAKGTIPRRPVIWGLL